MVQNKIILLFLFVPLLCGATDLKPWFGNEYEAELRVFLLYQNYDSVSGSKESSFEKDDLQFGDKDDCRRREDANDTYTTLSIVYPFKRFSGEFEVTEAHTRHQTFCIDNFRVTGRYQWLDDTTYGDPFSLVTSITLSEPLSRALHDISSFHHGHIEAEFCISYGKKYGYPCSKNYRFRWWNVIGIGVAEEGSPWYRADGVCEYKYKEIHTFRGFVNTLWGIGGKNLHLCNFKGYGPINHRSVDLGIRYSYGFGYWGTFSVQYARRVYAHNFPENANLVLFEYYLPFGMQVYTNY